MVEEMVVSELTALTNNKHPEEETSSPGLRAKAILLIACAVLILFQGFKEILTSEFIMNNVFNLLNNYVNSTRENKCNDKHE